MLQWDFDVVEIRSCAVDVLWAIHVGIHVIDILSVSVVIVIISSIVHVEEKVKFLFSILIYQDLRIVGFTEVKPSGLS